MKISDEEHKFRMQMRRRSQLRRVPGMRVVPSLPKKRLQRVRSMLFGMFGGKEVTYHFTKGFRIRRA